MSNAGGIHKDQNVLVWGILREPWTELLWYRSHSVRDWVLTILMDINWAIGLLSLAWRRLCYRSWAHLFLGEANEGNQQCFATSLLESLMRANSREAVERWRGPLTSGTSRRGLGCSNQCCQVLNQKLSHWKLKTIVLAEKLLYTEKLCR